MQWGGIEFGLTAEEKIALDEIYSEIDDRADNTFSKLELYRHIRDASDPIGTRKQKWKSRKDRLAHKTVAAYLSKYDINGT